MNPSVIESLNQVLVDVVRAAIERHAPGSPIPEPLGWGAPKNPEYGDLATNAAMLLTKSLRRNPAKIAEELAEPIRACSWIERVSIAAPGFVNIALSRRALGRMAAEPLEQGADFGHGRYGEGKSVFLEFVSANPTGPLHVGHARHAAVGDSLARLLEASGFKVHREFYINDAGNQIQTLGLSLRTRVLQILGDAIELPGDAYPGDYILYYAWQFLQEADPAPARGVNDDDLLGGADAERFSTRPLASKPDSPDSNAKNSEEDRFLQIASGQRAWIERARARLRESVGDDAMCQARDAFSERDNAFFADFAKSRILDIIRDTLAALRVRFDSYFSETSLYRAGATEATIAELRRADAVYESEGALWLRSTDKGDDKDRVLVKSDGAYTYLVPDLAYHRDKYHRHGGLLGDRGPDLLVNIFGSDHDGYPPRLKAGLDFLGCPPERLHILLMRLVFLVRQGERLDMGKRSGNFVSARDLLDEVGCDVLRFFLLQRSVNSEINFDLDLAREHSDRNPVFKIQYAHARICSLFRREQERGISWRGSRENDIEFLVAAEEKDIIREIARLPEMVERASRSLEPQPITVYLLGLADLFNGYWSQAKVDPEYRMIDPSSPDRTQARLSLAAAMRTAIANGLRLLGVEAPERMEREEEETG